MGQSVSTVVEIENPFDGYWSEPGRREAVAPDHRLFARTVMLLCGLSPVLDVGAGNGALVRDLVAAGVDARGIDLSRVAVEYANSLTPGRFGVGSAAALPVGDSSSYTIIASFVCEYLSPDEVAQALAEFYRVSQRYLVLRIRTKRSDGDSLAQVEQERAWWETACLKAGFRKHPLYYEVNRYEDLNHDGETITIPLEKVPAEALKAYPLAALADERNLHMDMTREVGERSDAHIIRYEWAAQYLRHGDAVLDAACGLGYGSYVIRQRGRAASVVGIDGSAYAVDYATKNFGSLDPAISFQEGYLPQCLSQFPDGSFDAILSFETLEHVEDPEGLLREFKRLLSPGGRVIVSVPNDWTDDTGKDPNPYHLHVYSFEKLRQQVSKEFLLEDIYQQIASGCKLREIDNRWHRQPRALRSVSLEGDSYPNSEWCLMVGFKDPVGATQPYRESFYRYSDGPEHLLQFARDYRNPWLVRSLVEFPTRAMNPHVLRDIAERVLADRANSGLPDEAAALCVIGYQMLGDASVSARTIQTFIERMRPHIERGHAVGHAQRWKLSLGYLAGQLYVKIGERDTALKVLESVAEGDLNDFSPSLGTKVINAAYECGMLHCAAGRVEVAREWWQRAVDRAFELLKAPQGEYVGQRENPITFPTVSGVEFLDSALRALKALRHTASTEPWVMDRLFCEARQNWKWMVDERAEALRACEERMLRKDILIRETEARLDETRAVLNHTYAELNDAVRAGAPWNSLQRTGITPELCHRYERLIRACEQGRAVLRALGAGHLKRWFKRTFSRPQP